MTGVREFIRDRSDDSTGLLGEFAAWMLKEHTVETGVIADHGGQDEIAYCGSCGQELDAGDACDHLIRLAAVWHRHSGYDPEWRPVDE